MMKPLQTTSAKPFKGYFGELLKLIALTALILWFASGNSPASTYNWQWYRVPDYFFSIVDGKWQPGPLLKGAWITIQISGVSLVLAFIIGLVTAVLRLSNSLIGPTIAQLYLELIRNTPLLVQIFFIYFVLSPILGIERFTSAILALSLFEGAYASEIIRAGILSVDKGQWEAAQSIGLNYFQIYRQVVLPQAFRYVLPPLTGQAVSLIKDSALVSTIAIYDLTMQGQAIIAETFMVFEVWFVVAATYLIMTGSISILAQLLEKNLHQKVRTN